MSPHEFREFLERATARRAARFSSRGIWTEEAALGAAQAAYARTFPDGRLRPPHTVCRLVEERGNHTVGELWYQSETEGGKVQFWINWIWIDPEHRRRGYATEALRAAESEARRRGAPKVGLDVWLDNLGALELYRKCGYRPIRSSLVKRVARGT